MIPIAAKLKDVDMIRLRDHVLTAPVFAGTPGDYPWDRWERSALAAGLDEDLAVLGRAVFREAFQHQWDDHLQVECGWLDGGQRMLFQAIGFPQETTQRWSHLLHADGGPDDSEVPPVETDPMELAEALERAGYPINIIRHTG